MPSPPDDPLPLDDPAPRARVRDLLRSGGRPLLGLLVLALGFKLLVILAANGDDPLARHLTSDSRFYMDRALGLAGLVDDPLADEPHHLPPLYPQLLLRLPGVLEGRFFAVQALQAVSGVALLAAVFLLARRRLGVPASLAAVLLTLAYGPLTFFEFKLLGDSLATSWLLVLLAGWDALRVSLAGEGRGDGAAGGSTSPARLAGAAALGAGLALVTLLRPQMMLLLPVVAVDLGLGGVLRGGRRAWPLAGAVLVAAGLVLTPSTLHNLRAGGGLTLVSDNGGVNLWLANAGPVSGTFRTADEAFGDIERQAASARRVAEQIAGRGLTPAEVGATLRSAALDAVLADPATFLRRVGLRGRALVETFETGIVCVPEVEAGLVGPLRILALPFGALLALGLGGFVLAGRGRRGEGGAPDVPGPAPWPLLVATGVVVLTTLLFFHYSRFRLPLVPLLALGAAAGGEAVWRRRAGAGRIAVAGVVAAGAAWLSWLPGPHHADTRAIGWTSLSEARLALVEDPADRGPALEAAAADVERALAASPTLLRAQLQQVRVSLSRDRFEACARALEAAEAQIPGHPQVLMNRAWLHARPHPNNRHFDPAAARALVEQLAFEAAADPELAPHVAALRRHLDGLEARGDG